MDNRQIVLEQIPQGKLTPEHFRLQTAPAPTPADGEVLVRTRYISLDAANRAWMQGATYRSALQAGDVMAGGSVAEVVESKAAGFKAGDLVFADTGWQEYAAVPGKGLSPLPELKPVTHLISVYGVAGLTAYFGLMECGRPQAGRPSWSRRRRARSARSSGNWPRSRVAGWWGSPAGPRNARG